MAIDGVVLQTTKIMDQMNNFRVCLELILFRKDIVFTYGLSIGISMGLSYDWTETNGYDTNEQGS